MKIVETIIMPDGTITEHEVEVADNYLDPPAPPAPTETDDLMALTIDHEYRLTLLELGITE